MGYSLKIYRIVFCIVFYWATILPCKQRLHAQQFKIDTSSSSIKKYKSIITQNQTLVNYIKNILQYNGLPTMLSNLALIESGFNKTAVSQKNAGGLWQFTKEHAAYYGLKEHERFDVYKSTKVVCQSLKVLYQKYHSWLSVIAAYNCGEGNIEKAIQKAHSNNFFTYYTYLPNETIKHVLKYINSCYASNEAEQLSQEDKDQIAQATGAEKEIKNNQGPANFNAIEINAAFSLKVIAQTLNISQDSIYLWNPVLEQSLAKNGKGLLYLPANASADFEMQKVKILNASLKYNGI